MNLFKIVLIGLTACSTLVLAQRTVEVYEHNTSVQDKGGTPRQALARLNINCVNLSGVRQSVRLQLYDQELEMNICVERPDAGVTSSWDIKPTCFGQKKYYPPTQEMSLTIGPKGNGNFRANVLCTFMKRGPVCDGSVTGFDFDFTEAYTSASGRGICTTYSPHEFAHPRSATFLDNCLRAATISYKTKMRIEVAGDRGALLCGGYVSPSMPWGPDNEISTAIVQVNGGRPF